MEYKNAYNMGKEIVNMQIHTFQTNKQISKEVSCKIQKDLKMDADKWKGDESGMTYWGLSDKGILIHT